MVFAREDARCLRVLLHGIALQRNVDEVMADGEHQFRLRVRRAQLDDRGGQQDDGYHGQDAESREKGEEMHERSYQKGGEG